MLFRKLQHITHVSPSPSLSTFSHNFCSLSFSAEPKSFLANHHTTISQNRLLHHVYSLTTNARLLSRYRRPQLFGKHDTPAYAQLAQVGHEITTVVKPKAVVVIQADQDARAGLMVEAMDQARLAGVPDVSIAAVPR